MLGRGLEEVPERLVGALTRLPQMLTPIEMGTPKKGVFWICASYTQLIKKFLTKFFIQIHSTHSKLSFELFERFVARLVLEIRFIMGTWKLTLKQILTALNLCVPNLEVKILYKKTLFHNT